MSVFGNFQGPYHAKGRRQCEEKLRTECRKLMVIVSEAPAVAKAYGRGGSGGDLSDGEGRLGGDLSDVAVYLACLDRIQDALRTMEKLRVDHE